jgi:hypothetical protein
MPFGAEVQAVSTWPLEPTVRGTGVFAADPVIRAPFAVMQEHGIAEGELNVAQQRPVGEAVHAVRTCPSPPTVSATGVFAAVPVTRAPLPVTQAQGIAAGEETVDQHKPVGAALHATRN